MTDADSDDASSSGSDSTADPVVPDRSDTAATTGGTAERVDGQPSPAANADAAEPAADESVDDAGYPELKLPSAVAYAHALISGGILCALIVFVFVSVFSVGTDSQISETVIQAIDAETVSSEKLEAILSVLQQHHDSQSLVQLRAVRIVSVFLGSTLLLSLGVMLASAVIFGSREHGGMWGVPAGKGHWMTPAIIALTLGGGLLVAALSMDLSSGAISADADQLNSIVGSLLQASGKE